RDGAPPEGIAERAGGHLRGRSHLDAMATVLPRRGRRLPDGTVARSAALGPVTPRGTYGRLSRSSPILSRLSQSTRDRGWKWGEPNGVEELCDGRRRGRDRCGRKRARPGTGQEEGRIEAAKPRD